MDDSCDGIRKYEIMKIPPYEYKWDGTDGVNPYNGVPITDRAVLRYIQRQYKIDHPNTPKWWPIKRSYGAWPIQSSPSPPPPPPNKKSTPLNQPMSDAQKIFRLIQKERERIGLEKGKGKALNSPRVDAFNIYHRDINFLNDVARPSKVPPLFKHLDFLMKPLRDPLLAEKRRKSMPLLKQIKLCFIGPTSIVNPDSTQDKPYFIRNIKHGKRWTAQKLAKTFEFTFKSHGFVEYYIGKPEKLIRDACLVLKQYLCLVYSLLYMWTIAVEQDRKRTIENIPGGGGIQPHHVKLPNEMAGAVKFQRFGRSKLHHSSRLNMTLLFPTDVFKTCPNLISMLSKTPTPFPDKGPEHKKNILFDRIFYGLFQKTFYIFNRLETGSITREKALALSNLTDDPFSIIALRLKVRKFAIKIASIPIEYLAGIVISSISRIMTYRLVGFFVGANSVEHFLKPFQENCFNISYESVKTTVLDHESTIYKILRECEQDGCLLINNTLLFRLRLETDRLRKYFDLEIGVDNLMFITDIINQAKKSFTYKYAPVPRRSLINPPAGQDNKYKALFNKGYHS